MTRGRREADRRGGGNPVTRLLAAVLIGAGLALLGTVPAQGVADLPQDGDALRVEVTSVEPANPVPEGTITVRGTITNLSGDTAEGVEALLRVSAQPLTNRSEVAEVTDLTTARRGAPVAATRTPVAEALAASAAAGFTITAQAADLPLGRNGVYAVFVEARSTAGTVATAFPMTWFPSPETLVPSRLVVMNPIRAAVDLSAGGTLQSSELPRAMAPAGRLGALAAAGEAAAARGIPMTWLIDPAVTDAASKLSAGTAGFAASEADAGAARDVVSAWLEAVRSGSAAKTSLSYITPYAEVDSSAVVAAGMPDLLRQAASAAPRAATASIPVRNGTMAAPPAGGPTKQALEASADAGIRTVVIEAAALPPAAALSYTPSGVADVEFGDSTVTALIPDDMLTAGLSRPSATPAEAFRLRAGLLADAAMITLELPVSSRTVVMLPPEDRILPASVYSGVLAALSAAPYIDLVGVTALFEADVPRVARRESFPSTDSAALSSDYLSPIPGIEGRLRAFSNVTVDPLAFEQEYRAALLRSASANWRTALPEGERLLAGIGDDLTGQEQKVTTVSTGTVTFTGSTGTLPLTVSNGLDQAVDVGVLLQADPSVRLSYLPAGLVRVEAGRRVSIEIAVEVFGSGPLPVTVILTDRNGRPFVETGDLIIRATGASTVAALVVIVGAVALLILVVWRFRRRGADRT